MRRFIDLCLGKYLVPLHTNLYFFEHFVAN